MVSTEDYDIAGFMGCYPTVCGMVWGEPKLRWEVTEVTGSCAMVGLVSWGQKSLK